MITSFFKYYYFINPIFFFFLQVLSGSSMVHLQRWHNTVIHQPQFSSVYKAEAFKQSLISHKEQSSSKNTVASQKKQKLKILCLHGYRQTSTTFHEKTGAFRKIVGSLCDLVVVNAPHVVPPEAHGSESTDEQRGWWFSQPNGYFKVKL